MSIRSAWKLNLFKERISFETVGITLKKKRTGKEESEERNYVYKSLQVSGLYIGCNIRIRGYTNFKRFSASTKDITFQYHFVQFELKFPL